MKAELLPVLMSLVAILSSLFKKSRFFKIPTVRYLGIPHHYTAVHGYFDKRYGPCHILHSGGLYILQVKLAQHSLRYDPDPKNRDPQRTRTRKKIKNRHPDRTKIFGFPAQGYFYRSARKRKLWTSA